MADTHIAEAEFSTAAARLRAGEDAIDVLDERYVAAFSIAGTPEDCLVAARRYHAAGVTELALTFLSIWQPARTSENWGGVLAAGQRN